MDAFEGIHRVHISSSPPSSASSTPGYEVLMAGPSGIAVYSSPAFFGTSNVPAVKHKSSRLPEEERCVVGQSRDENSTPSFPPGSSQLIRADRRGESRVSVVRSQLFKGTERCFKPGGCSVWFLLRAFPLKLLLFFFFFFLRRGFKVLGLVSAKLAKPFSVVCLCKNEENKRDERKKLDNKDSRVDTEIHKLVDLDPEPVSKLEGGGRDGPASAHGNLCQLRSSSLEIKEKEIREKGSEILREQLDTAKKELKLKDKECERLSQVRNQLEQELEELTASLFEEAHKMVREANVKQAGAEKQLKEAQGKIDVMQAEVTALKTLVLTSTPSSPNLQLHPQLRSTAGTHKRGAGHIRNNSGGFQTSSGKSEPSGVSIQSVAKDEREMDSILFAEFSLWKEQPSLDRSSAFLSRIYREDIGPGLSFTRSELSQLVQRAVENNSLTIEPVGMSAVPMVKASALECGGPNGFGASVETKCALSGLSRVCRHRIKLGDKGSYYYISPSSRARITAVCNFFTYIRYILQGLVRQNAEQIFWEVMRLRREMSVAKLGFCLTDLG